jgi:hypothetical protein
MPKIWNNPIFFAYFSESCLLFKFQRLFFRRRRFNCVAVNLHLVWEQTAAGSRREVRLFGPLPADCIGISADAHSSAFQPGRSIPPSTRRPRSPPK